MEFMHFRFYWRLHCSTFYKHCTRIQSIVLCLLVISLFRRRRRRRGIPLLITHKCTVHAIDMGEKSEWWVAMVQRQCPGGEPAPSQLPPLYRLELGHTLVPKSNPYGFSSWNWIGNSSNCVAMCCNHSATEALTVSLSCTYAKIKNVFSGKVFSKTLKSSLDRFII